MESYDAGSRTPGLLEETIGASFERTVSARPDHEALVEVASGRRWTWAELNTAANDAARGLLAFGVEKGDRVGIWAPNCAEWTITQVATAKIGAILVNINPAYRTHELAYVINQSGLRALVAMTGFKTSDYRAMIDEVAHECPTLERTIYLDTDDWADFIDAEKDLAEGAVAKRMAELTPADAINIQYTSGVEELFDLAGVDVLPWIQLKDGAEPLDANAIREFATGKLADYKIPRYVILVDEFPMTITGKVRKVEMRERSLSALGHE